MGLNDTINIELGPASAGLYWFSRKQLRTSAAYVAAVVRRMERATGARIGAREDEFLIRDLAEMSDEELDLLRKREIQKAAILLDEKPAGYRLRTDGSRWSGALILDVPQGRDESLWDALDAEIAEFTAKGERIAIPR